MKFCNTCNKNKPKTQFSINKYRKDKLNWQCKECHSAYRKAHYEKNKKKYIDKAKKFKIEQIEKFNIYKSTLKCRICLEKEAVCLDFHHLDPTKKEYGISLIRTISFSKTLEEIKKCIVLCANCHRKVHAGIIQLVE